MTDRANILVFALAVVAAAYVVHLVNLRQLRSKYALLWAVIAALLLPLAAFPGLRGWVSDVVGIESAANTFFAAAIGFMFFVVVHFSWELSRLESKVRVLAEEVALLRAEPADEQA